jgi:hypothetical protein
MIGFINTLHSQLVVTSAIAAIAQGREANRSPPSSAEVPSLWSYASSPTHITLCRGALLFKSRDSFVVFFFTL